MDYYGKPVVELTRNEWDGKPRYMIVWNDDVPNSLCYPTYPARRKVVYCRSYGESHDYPWLDSDGLQHQHCGEIPADCFNVGRLYKCIGLNIDSMFHRSHYGTWDGKYFNSVSYSGSKWTPESVTEEIIPLDGKFTEGGLYCMNEGESGVVIKCIHPDGIFKYAYEKNDKRDETSRNTPFVPDNLNDIEPLLDGKAKHAESLLCIEHHPVTNRELAEWLAAGNGQIAISVGQPDFGSSVRTYHCYPLGKDDEPANTSIELGTIKVRKKGDNEWYSLDTDYMGITLTSLWTSIPKVNGVLC